jgi:DNA-binding PadR family transcriptional regulator
MKLADYLVLGVIEQCGPSSGYDIVQELQNREVESWTDLKIGSVYHAISKLEKQAFVTPQETTKEGQRPAKTIYEITKKGQAYFDELQEKAFNGLYPHYYGMLLGLVFNLRRPISDIQGFAESAIEGLKDKLRCLEEKECDISHVPESMRPIIEKRIALYRSHIMRQIEAEKEWIEDVLDNIDLFDNSEIQEIKYKGRHIQ